MFRTAPVLVTLLATLLATTSLACGGSDVQVKTTSADTTVAQQRTYAHEVEADPPEGHATIARTPVVLEKAWRAVDEEMKKKGYVLAPISEADLVVRISSGARTELEQPEGAKAAAGAPADVETKSVLAVDIVDRRTNASFFRGNATKDVHTDEVDEAEVRAAVAEIFEKVPARR